MFHFTSSISGQQWPPYQYIFAEMGKRKKVKNRNSEKKNFFFKSRAVSLAAFQLNSQQCTYPYTNTGCHSVGSVYKQNAACPLGLSAILAYNKIFSVYYPLSLYIEWACLQQNVRKLQRLICSEAQTTGPKRWHNVAAMFPTPVATVRTPIKMTFRCLISAPLKFWLKGFNVQKNTEAMETP